MDSQEAALFFISANKSHVTGIATVVCLKEYRSSAGPCASDKPNGLKQGLGARTVFAFKSSKAESTPRRDKDQCRVDRVGEWEIWDCIGFCLLTIGKYEERKGLL